MSFVTVQSLTSVIINEEIGDPFREKATVYLNVGWTTGEFFIAFLNY